MPYIQEPKNLTTIKKMWDYNNAVTDYLLSNGVLIAIYFSVLLFSLRKYGSYDEHAFTGSMIAAGFFTSMAAVFLRLAGVLPDKTLLLCIISFALPLFYSFIRR